MTIFDIHQQIHRKNIEEAENKRIDNWLKHIKNSTSVINDLNLLYMAAGAENNRTIKILIKYIQQKWIANGFEINNED